MRMAEVFSSGGAIQYLLPTFQREYAWEKGNWETLLKDALAIYDAYDPENVPEHFMGALVVISDGTRGTMSVFKLVDGQQRLTTISIFLAALSVLIRESHPALYKEIRSYLENADKSGDLKYKLVPTIKFGDRESFFQIIDEQAPTSEDSRIPSAFQYAKEQLHSAITTGRLDPERLFLAFANCMHVVFINVDARERPFEIFESLNAKGKVLTQPDLIRNYIAMKLSASSQDDVFTKYWSEIENLLRESRLVSRIGELTAFLRHYLAFQKGILFRTDHIYARFRDRMEKDFPTQSEFIAELETIHRFAHYYNRFLRPEKETDAEIQNALKRLNVLEATTAYPFLLALFDKFNLGQIKRDVVISSLKAVENYLVRRYLSKSTSGYTNKMFPTLMREVDSKDFVSSLRKALARKNYPSDRRLWETVASQKLYDSRNTSRLVLILETINLNLSKGTDGYTVLNDEATIEHIMPQILSTAWKQELGENWEQVHTEYCDTIGNLTLVTQDWNSSLSNASFAVKQGRLANHALRINQSYFSDLPPEWNEGSIKNRAKSLTQEIVKIWPEFRESAAESNFRVGTQQ